VTTLGLFILWAFTKDTTFYHKIPKNASSKDLWNSEEKPTRHAITLPQYFPFYFSFSLKLLFLNQIIQSLSLFPYTTLTLALGNAMNRKGYNLERAQLGWFFPQSEVFAKWNHPQNTCSWAPASFPVCAILLKWNVLHSSPPLSDFSKPEHIQTPFPLVLDCWFLNQVVILTPSCTLESSSAFYKISYSGSHQTENHHLYN